MLKIFCNTECLHFLEGLSFLILSLLLFCFSFKTALLSKLFLLLQSNFEGNDALNYFYVFALITLEKTFIYFIINFIFLFTIHQIISFSCRMFLYIRFLFNVFIRLIPFLLKDFNLGKVEEIHSNFQTLISEINNPSNAYVLKTANGLYAEKTYPFLKVSANMLFKADGKQRAMWDQSMNSLYISLGIPGTTLMWSTFLVNNHLDQPISV